MSQASDERNYHIFYCLLAGLTTSEKQELSLSNASDFYYLNQVGSSISVTYQISSIGSIIFSANKMVLSSLYESLLEGGALRVEGRNDAADLAEIRSSMKILMFKDSEIWSIFKILAAILHAGNIKYIGKRTNCCH